MSDVANISRKIIAAVESVVIGKRQQVVLALAAVYCEGHVLLEDVPGVAKTMLARALARSIEGRFRRVQCTPDLLPTDVTGASVFNQKEAEFEFRPGPVFANVLLADEINRATPRTQAALLEAMAEGQVSSDGRTYELPRPFLVIATQNPVDHEGVFPLPEAQLDRFLMRMSLGYPGRDEEAQMLDRLNTPHPISSLAPVVSAKDVRRCQEAIRGVYVDPKVRDYILALIAATRTHDDLALGGSPRASMALYRAGQALAAIRSRAYVLPDDVKRLTGPVLGHRLVLKPEARLRKTSIADVLADLLEDVPAPSVPAEAAG